MKCRLCESPTLERFRKTVLGHLDVGYRECQGCGALQTEEPTWLELAYSPEIHGLGVDSAYRTAWSQACVAYLLTVFNFPRGGKVLDFGGGTGHLCRLLRDIGFDAWNFDRHTEAPYAKGFEADPAQVFDAIVSFETFEHLARPAEDVVPIFAGHPELVIIGTLNYRGEGPDWYYVFPEWGQHVFFWSRGAHEFVARRHGYHVIVGSQLAVYARRPFSARQRALFRGRSYATKALQCLLPLFPRPGARRDSEAFFRKAEEYGRKLACASDLAVERR